MKIFTLKNCDTCKKALKWLDGQAFSYENHDVRTDGLTADIIAPLMQSVGWEVLINRRSTTWRGLDETRKADLNDNKAIALILENPTLMKRPVFVRSNTVLVGFNAEIQKQLSA